MSQVPPKSETPSSETPKNGSPRVAAPEHERPETIESRNPATGELLGSVQATPPGRIDEVVRAVAQVQPLWALLRVEDRARYMRRMAQAIIDELDELMEAIGREQGRPRAEVAALELLPAIDALIWIADDGAKVLGSRRVGIHRSMSLARRARIAYEPYGVIGVIGAGSAPFAQPLGQIAGALLAGNGVVFKPAARACLTAERIARVLARADLPEGLVALAHGDARVGVALAKAPVAKVLFTGSPAVGREVARACVSSEKEVTVELGGKDAMLVLADCNVARAAEGALWAGCAGCDVAFYAPTVITGVTGEMRLMREPVDGPVLAVMTVDSMEEAIALANDSDYGLGASVWSTDRYRGLRIARELHAGMVWLNDHLPGPAVSRGPWGAAAGGGLGRVLGEAGLRACAQEKLIVWSQPGMRGLWWGPYDGVLEGGGRAVAQLRSARDSDRERAWRHGAVGLARVGARALGRGIPR
jgi:acyl-CoA reductase-like NAD-dependent aldehyde dehydrogenase